MAITIADLVPVHAVHDLEPTLRWQMMRGYTGTTAYGKNPVDTTVGINLQESRSIESVEAAGRYTVAMFKHAKYIAENSAFLFSPVMLSDQDSVTIAKFGLNSTWDRKQVSTFFVLSQEAVLRELGDTLESFTADDSMSDYYTWLGFKEERLDTSFLGDQSKPILQRALWSAKRKAMEDVLQASGDAHVYGSTDQTKRYYIQLHTRGREGLTLVEYHLLKRAVDVVNNHKVTGRDMQAQRDSLLRMQRTHQVTVDQQRNATNGKRFGSYWQQLKSTQQIPELHVATAEWSRIPMKPPGEVTSRTWGIEIETIRAGDTSRPPGWESRYDGSLPNGDSDCACECGGCSDGDDHCNDSDDECYGGGGDSSREFVSPILRHFNSSGLQQLCKDLGTDEDEDDSPGIHVHVGADDLTVADVSRLLLSYSIVEQLIVPLLYRNNRHYCVVTPAETLRWWLSKVSEYRRTSPDSVPTPADILRTEYQTAPTNRYVDLNLESLKIHGTVEFRSMGPWYDYEHLTRWAWFAREMVNVCTLGIDQREWLACTSVADVITLLRKYGSEIPSSNLYITVPTKELLLSSTEE
jgi:hypothetical protein